MTAAIASYVYGARSQRNTRKATHNLTIDRHLRSRPLRLPTRLIEMASASRLLLARPYWSGRVETWVCWGAQHAVGDIRKRHSHRSIWFASFSATLPRIARCHWIHVAVRYVVYAMRLVPHPRTSYG
jgi:hypothetical protein